jgi:hypothetical protein
MIATTASRVTDVTADEINSRLHKETEERVAYYAALGTDAINGRLAELDREWDIERALEANAAVAVIVGVALGITVNRRWFLFPAVVGGFLLQHAVQGWCPPLPILRRLGFRTAEEIAWERYALKALRGDFRGIEPVEVADRRGQAEEAVGASRR